MDSEHRSRQTMNWRCPVCGSQVMGRRNARDRLRAECERCRTVMIRTASGRRHITLEIYTPENRTIEHGTDIRIAGLG